MAITGPFLIAIFVVCAAGVFLSALLGRKRVRFVLAIAGALSAILMVLTSASVLVMGQPFEAALWTLDGFGRFSIHIDSVSSIFLLITGVVYFSISLFVGGFLKHQADEAHPQLYFSTLYFALMASVVLILMAGDIVLFLISWECMSILCFLLINYDPRGQSDKSAGYIMLAMSEAGFLAVAVAFLFLARSATDFSFAALRAASETLPPEALWLPFLLGFFGFGVKAGLVPVNFWLPRSYTAAPPVFIPVFAGITLNLGFYGILRLNTDLIHAGYGMGLVALITGSVTALVGILYATTDGDMKTMLAHSSIENAGIIVAALGAFLVFRAFGQPVPAALALSAALYHMVNHSIYKTLLFEGAGHVEAATGTRDMDQLGGLARLLPGLSAIFLVGCLAISAVPPFNGFVSEWMALQALLRSAVLASTSVRIVFALCGAALALTAALAVTCFVKTYAMNFLGIRRGTWKLRGGVQEMSKFPLAYLAVICLLLGILPTYVLPILNQSVESLASTSVTTALVQPFFTATPENAQLPAAFLQDFHNLGAQTGRGLIPGRGLVVLLRGGEANPVVFAMSPSYSIIVLVVLFAAAWFGVRRLTRHRILSRRPVWAGGIPRLLPLFTYTGTGFSNPVRVVFQAIFRPNIIEDTRQTVAVHFRTAIHRQREETHVVDRLLLKPVGTAVQRVAAFLAGMHHGKLNAYITYVLAFLLLMLFIYRGA
jgi:hydrogenase-4 component B